MVALVPRERRAERWGGLRRRGHAYAHALPPSGTAGRVPLRTAAATAPPSPAAPHTTTTTAAATAADGGPLEAKVEPLILLELGGDRVRLSQLRGGRGRLPLRRLEALRRAPRRLRVRPRLALGARQPLDDETG